MLFCMLPESFGAADWERLLHCWLGLLGCMPLGVEAPRQGRPPLPPLSAASAGRSLLAGTALDGPPSPSPGPRRGCRAVRRSASAAAPATACSLAAAAPPFGTRPTKPSPKAGSSLPAQASGAASSAKASSFSAATSGSARHHSNIWKRPRWRVPTTAAAEMVIGTATGAATAVAPAAPTQPQRQSFLGAVRRARRSVGSSFTS
jgi:hypothetical protein